MPYSALKNLSSADILFEEVRKKSRPRTVGVFTAEYVIAQRKDKKVYCWQFQYMRFLYQ